MAGGEGEGDPPSGLPPVPHQPPEQQQQPPPPPSDEESPPSPSNSNSGNSMSGDGNSGNGDGNDDSTNSSTVTGWPPGMCLHLFSNPHQQQQQKKTFFLQQTYTGVRYTGVYMLFAHFTERLRKCIPISVGIIWNIRDMRLKE